MNENNEYKNFKKRWTNFFKKGYIISEYILNKDQVFLTTKTKPIVDPARISTKRKRGYFLD